MINKINVFYPTSKDQFEDYKLIYDLLKEDVFKGESKREILRYANMGYSKELFSVLERLLVNKGTKEFAESKIYEKDSLKFKNNLQEIALCDFFLKSEFKIKCFDGDKDNEKKPEFYLEKENKSYLVELYSPRDLAAYLSFDRDLLAILKFHNKTRGKSIDVQLKDKGVAESGQHVFINSRESLNKRLDAVFSNHPLNSMLIKVTNYLDSMEELKYNTDYLINIHDDIDLLLHVNNKDCDLIWRDCDDEPIPFKFFFDLERKEKFLKKIKDKIQKGQLNIQNPKGLRVFLIDFSMTQEGKDLFILDDYQKHKTKIFSELRSFFQSDPFKLPLDTFVDIVIPICINGMDVYWEEALYDSSGFAKGFFNDLKYCDT